MVVIVADYPELALRAFNCGNLFLPNLKTLRQTSERPTQQPKYAQVTEGCGQPFNIRMAMTKAYWLKRGAEKTAHSIPLC